MGYYHRDPTANMALGTINREFSRLEKKARLLRKLQDEGKLSPQALQEAQSQFKGIYRHILTNELNRPPKKAKVQCPSE